MIKLTFALTISFYLRKIENRTKKISNTAFILLLIKCLFFAKKMLTLAKLMGS